MKGTSPPGKPSLTILHQILMNQNYTLRNSVEGHHANKK